MPGDDWGRAGAARQEGGSGLAGPGNSANCLKKLFTIFFVIVVTIASEFFPVVLSQSWSLSAFLVDIFHFLLLL